MRGPLGLALLVLALGAGCSGSRTTSPDPFTALRRPLHVARLRPGARCPVSAARPRADFVRYGVRRGLGRGPAYPITGPTVRLEFPPPGTSEFIVGGWGGQRTLWFVAPSYRGPLLVRGRRLDGPDPVRFDLGRIPPGELRIAPGEIRGWPVGVTSDDGQRYRRSYTRLRAPGCYAFQVDGTSFSYTIVFRAELAVGIPDSK